MNNAEKLLRMSAQSGGPGQTVVNILDHWTVKERDLFRAALIRGDHEEMRKLCGFLPHTSPSTVRRIFSQLAHATERRVEVERRKPTTDAKTLNRRSSSNRRKESRPLIAFIKDREK